MENDASANEQGQQTQSASEFAASQVAGPAEVIKLPAAEFVPEESSTPAPRQPK
jgi:hypothetical protein